MLKKIVQIKAEDWEKALSFDKEIFTNGIFKIFSNCNPFFNKGNFQPVQTPTQLGSGTINTSKVIRSILTVYTSNLPQFYVWADDGKVYITDGASLTDVSAQIASGSYTHREAQIWLNKIIYIKDTEARANAIPLASGSDVQILTGLTTGPHPFTIGADRYGYIGNGNNVAKLVIATGTVGNSTSVATSLESGYIVRKLINDGRYLVWIADNATVTATTQKFSCIVAFWDMAKSTFDQIYEFQDNYIAGAEIIGDVIKIVTPSGIWITNSNTRPKLILPFQNSSSTILNTEVPLDFHCTTIFEKNILLWGSSLTSGNNSIYGYGNFIYGKPDRLFQPYTVTSNPITALATNDNDTVVAVGTSGSVKLYILNNSGTNESAVANTAGIVLPQPFNYHHARIVTRLPISSGNSVALKILNSNSTKTIKASEAKTNTTDSGEKNLIFDHTAAGDGTDVKAFDEISDIEITTNVAIKSFELWGEAEDERASYG